MPPPLSNRKSRAKASNAEDDELERRAAEIEAAEQAAETEQDEARTREEYLARAKLDKRDSNGIMDLSFWIWEGNKITTIVDDNAIRTRDLLDKLRRSRYNDVRTIIENDNILERLIIPKEIRRQGQPMLCEVDFSRQQQASAVAAHMFLPKVNIKPCQACPSAKSRGPFNECVSFGTQVFGGACSCCQYSSLATSCIFHKNRKGAKYAEQSETESEEDIKFPNITSNLLKNVTTNKLERALKMIRRELEDRDEEDDRRPTKRRRR